MAHNSITYDSANGLILIVLRGAIDKAAIDETRAEAARLAKQWNCFNVLADLREAGSAVSTMDIFELPQSTAELLAAQGLSVHRFKRALVVGREIGDPTFFEAVSFNRGQNVRLFLDMEAAKQWLRED